MSDNNLTRIKIANVLNNEIGISHSESSYFVDVIVNEMNEYIVVGLKQSTENGEYDIWIIKIDAAGNLVWEEVIFFRVPLIGVVKVTYISRIHRIHGTYHTGI